MSTNPLEEDEDRQTRIRDRAYQLWQADGEPAGGDLEFWERARELVALEESVGAGQLPLPDDTKVGLGGRLIEEASIQENLGEFPDRLSDQGERAQTPSPNLRHD